MAFTNPDEHVIRDLLEQAEVIAVIGLSPKLNRPSHGVARALQGFGYRIIPVVGRYPRAKHSEAVFGETDKSAGNVTSERSTFASSSDESLVSRSGARPIVKEVLGEQAYARLEDVPDKIDLVDVFRAPQYVDAIVDSCITLGIPAIWLQEGVINDSAALRAQDAGLTVVMDRCTYKDYIRLCR